MQHFLTGSENLDKLSEAICFATAAFDGMERKVDRHPAILHSLEAATITQTLTDEKEAVIAAVLAAIMMVFIH